MSTSSEQKTYCVPDMSGVIYRTGLASRDYDEAIQALQDAKRQTGNESNGCTVCCSSGHTSMNDASISTRRLLPNALRTSRCVSDAIRSVSMLNLVTTW